ncbi:hypothetical protein D3C80_2149190 [compost metagenome]
MYGPAGVSAGTVTHPVVGLNVGTFAPGYNGVAPISWVTVMSLILAEVIPIPFKVSLSNALITLT